MALHKSDISEAVRDANAAAKKAGGPNGLTEAAAVAATDISDTFTEGEPILIRSVTHHFLGRFKRVSWLGTIPILHLTDVSWVERDGDFTEMLEKGKIAASHATSKSMRLSFLVVLDIYPWDFPLPKVR